MSTNSAITLIILRRRGYGASRTLAAAGRAGLPGLRGRTGDARVFEPGLFVCACVLMPGRAGDRRPGAGTLTIAAGSIDTKNKMRDKDLRSAKLFDVASHPDITFTADGNHADSPGGGHGAARAGSEGVAGADRHHIAHRPSRPRSAPHLRHRGD